MIINTGNVEETEDLISQDHTEVYKKHSYQMGIEGARIGLTYNGIGLKCTF